MRKKIIIVTAIVLPILILFTMWAVNNHNNETRYNEERAAFYDDVMKATYPFIEQINSLLTSILNDMEDVAKQAHYFAPYDFEETYEKITYQRDKYNPGRYQAEIMLRPIGNVFIFSAVYRVLSNGGKLRENESGAFRKFVDVLRIFNNGIDYSDYDVLTQEIQSCKEKLVDATQKLSKYKNNIYNVDSWRNVDLRRGDDISKRYKERKNWPFNFLNKEE